MVTFNNLLNNPNILTADQLGGMRVLEYEKDLSVRPDNAIASYYASEMNVRRRQLLLGRPVELLLPGRPPQPAWAVDIDRQARLVVRLPDGSTQTLSAGEVRARPLEEEKIKENEVDL